MIARIFKLATAGSLMLAPLAVFALEKGKTVVTPEPLGAFGFIKVVAALVVVLAMIAAMAWLMRRVNHVVGGKGALLQVVGAVSVGGRERVVLVQVGEQQLLLGVSPGSVQTLHLLDKPVSSQTAAAGGEGFAEKLQAALKRARGES